MLDNTSVESKVTQLRDLIKAEPRLKSQLDHDFLIKFLRARKYDVTAAFRTVREYKMKMVGLISGYLIGVIFFQVLQYYEIRRGMGDNLFRFCPEALRPALDTNMFVVLKNRDAFGRQILLFRAGMQIKG